MPVPGWVFRTPFLTGASIVVPWFGGAILGVYRRHERVGCIAALVSESRAQQFCGRRRRVRHCTKL